MLKKSSQCAERDDYGKSVAFRLTYKHSYTQENVKQTQAPAGVQHFYSRNPCSQMHAECTGTFHRMLTKRFSWHDAKQTHCEVPVNFLTAKFQLTQPSPCLPSRPLCYLQGDIERLRNGRLFCYGFRMLPHERHLHVKIVFTRVTESPTAFAVV